MQCLSRVTIDPDGGVRCGPGTGHPAQKRPGQVTIHEEWPVPEVCWVCPPVNGVLTGEDIARQQVPAVR